LSSRRSALSSLRSCYRCCGFARVAKNRSLASLPCLMAADSRECQPVTLDVNPSSRFFSMGSARPSTPLPRKVGFCKRPISCKLLKVWSGRGTRTRDVQLGKTGFDCKRS
jgi:hypothetical protein